MTDLGVVEESELLKRVHAALKQLPERAVGEFIKIELVENMLLDIQQAARDN